MIRMTKNVLWIYWELIKLVILGLCFSGLVLLGYAAAFIPIFAMLIYTNWSVLTIAALFFLECVAGVCFYKFYYHKAYKKARKYLAEQIKARKPNPETHCPACGYDLRGLRCIRCPECGKFNPKFNPQRFLDQNQIRKKQNKNKRQKQRKPR